MPEFRTKAVAFNTTQTCTGYPRRQMRHSMRDSGLSENICIPIKPQILHVAARIGQCDMGGSLGAYSDAPHAIAALGKATSRTEHQSQKQRQRLGSRGTVASSAVRHARGTRVWAALLVKPATMRIAQMPRMLERTTICCVALLIAYAVYLNVQCTKLTIRYTSAQC